MIIILVISLEPVCDAGFQMLFVSLYKCMGLIYYITLSNWVIDIYVGLIYVNSQRNSPISSWSILLSAF